MKYILILFITTLTIVNFSCISKKDAKNASSSTQANKQAEQPHQELHTESNLQIDRSELEMQLQNAAKYNAAERTKDTWPKLLIVATKLDFDTSQLENKEGIEVLNTVEFSILYIQIRVQEGTDLQWLAKQKTVLSIKEDVERTIFSQ